MAFALIDILLAGFFTAGIVILFWALREESKEKAPFYITPTTVAAMIVIAATFIAALLSN